MEISRKRQKGGKEGELLGVVHGYQRGWKIRQGCLGFGGPRSGGRKGGELKKVSTDETKTIMHRCVKTLSYESSLEL